MASGILSVGLQMQGSPALPAALLAMLPAAPSASSPSWRAPTCWPPGWHAATAVLLGLAGVVWLVLVYAVPWTAVLSRRTRPVVSTANGTWFIWVVASQSVAVAAAALDPVLSSDAGRHALSRRRSGLAAGWWRHRVHRVPLRYDPSLWSVVFPLGMYAVASIHLGRADGLPIVGLVGAAWLWVALGVWALVLAAMLVHLVRRLLLGREDATVPAGGPGLPETG